MDRRTSATLQNRKRRRRTTLLWSAGVAAIIIILLLTEQIPLLYVLATLSVTALLIIVALADLGEAHRPASELSSYDDSAAIADGRTRTPTFGSTGHRTAKH